MTKLRINVPLLVGILIGVTGFCVGFTALARLRARRVAAPPATAHAGELDPRFVYKVELGTAPARGAADALVTIVEFSSYGCAGCRAVEQSLQRLADEAPGMIRIVWKDLPASANERRVARAARAADAQGRFWELHDRLASLAPPIDDNAVAREAERLGLDMGRFHAALAAATSEHEIAADGADAYRFGLQRAPALFINGKYVPEPSLERLRAQIDEERAFAEQLIADGTPPSRIYAALMRGALASAGVLPGTPLPNEWLESLK